ncbi:MAG: putative rane transporter protein [Lacunisphaera sp.]|jgi:uncharacterized membrane protein YfcA|nr:putative rane transporter protein [Lacunisphaera sp.]
MVQPHSALSKLTAPCTLADPSFMPVSPHLPLWAYPVLFVTALVAGTVDAIAGGGGLIVLPALLGFGLPAPLALATSKLQSTFGSGSAAWSFHQRGAVNLRECRLGFVLTAIGAVAGAFTVRLLDPQFLGALIPWLLGAIVVYMIFRPRLGETSRHHRLEPGAFYLVFGLALGFYDGFFGPGVGSFWTIAFVTVLGHDFVRAAGHTKVMNFASNLAALIFFAAAGTVLWLPGLVMGVGQLLGGRLGAHLAVTGGARFVRPIFLAMASLVALKLIYASLSRGP